MGSTRRACRIHARRFPATGPQLLDLWEADRGHDAASAASVSEWRSRGTVGRTIAQTSAARKPTFQPLSSYGTPRVSFDGTDCLHVAQGVLEGRATMGLVLICRAPSEQNGTYVLSEPDSTAGSNGWDMGLALGNGFVSWVKTDTAAATSHSAIPDGGYTGQNAMIEATIDLGRSGQEYSRTVSRFGWAYTNLTGNTIDADSNTFSVGDFSNAGFSLDATVDVMAIAVLGVGLSPGQRRRVFRYATRKWHINPLRDLWRDGTFAFVL